MFWIILAAVPLIWGIVDAVRNREGTSIVMGFLVSLATAFIGIFCYAGIGMCIPADEVYETNNKQICAISDNTGTFFVGRYSVESRTYYCYLEETSDGGKAMKKADTGKAVIYDDEAESPYVITLEKRNSNPVVNFFFYTDKEEYRIHIPPKSIKYNFNVDLE